MGEIPEGLDDLLNEIRGGTGSTSTIPAPDTKKEQKLVEEDIDPRILVMLGLEFTKDIDYGTYKTLLKEKMLSLIHI